MITFFLVVSISSSGYEPEDCVVHYISSYLHFLTHTPPPSFFHCSSLASTLRRSARLLARTDLSSPASSTIVPPPMEPALQAFLSGIRHDMQQGIPCDVPLFDGRDFAKWQRQMTLFLRELIPPCALSHNRTHAAVLTGLIT